MNVSVILSVGNTIIWSPADFVRLPTDKEIISLILIVGLFEIWETEPPKIQKNAFKKVIKLIFILRSQIIIWSSTNQQDFCLPGVSDTGKELRLGVFP